MNLLTFLHQPARTAILNQKHTLVGKYIEIILAVAWLVTRPFVVWLLRSLGKYPGACDISEMLLTVLL